jgi:ribosomal protein S12 methylthiotransferase
MTQPLRVAFVSLGCAKNLVDSEKMLGQLAEAGCAITADEAHADVMVINTCGFLEASRLEADEAIRDAVKLKSRRNGLKRVVVAGCLVQRDKETILDRVTGIDALVGVNNRDDIVDAVLGPDGDGGRGRPRPSKKAAREARPPVQIHLSEYHPFVQLDTARLRLTPRHYAYLRISEGCDQKCTFCTIPSIRGPMHCKPPQAVLQEARELVEDGVREVHLIGQDTSSYGIGDDSVEGGLGSLLRQLNRVDGLDWIRLMYVYPTSVSDDIIEAVAECEKVCKYIDIPLQHINDRVLKSMHRRIDRKGTETLLDKLRTRIPGVAIRTTLIAGFPGETESEFNELEAFVRTAGFEALGVFPYSLEKETPSGRMKEQLPDELKKERVERLMLAQQEVAFALADRRVGSTMRVLLDAVTRDGRALGRHYGQAPTVDSVTLMSRVDMPAGEFIDVRITGRKDYDLLAAMENVPLSVLRA